MQKKLCSLVKLRKHTKHKFFIFLFFQLKIANIANYYKMYINVISAYRDIVAISDADLMGKTFEEGKKILNIKESFYKGEKKTKEEIIEIIKFHTKEDATFNVVGEKSTQLLLDLNLIPKDAISKIAGIPYTMIFL